MGQHVQEQAGRQGRRARPTALRALARWAVGFAAALLICRVILPTVSDSIEPVAWDPETGILVREAGLVHRHRTEGHGLTVIGKHGVNGVPDVTQLPGPVIALWGDSHVAGLGVVDADKMAQQLHQHLDGLTDGPRSAFGVGHGDTNVALTAYLMPRFEQLVPTLAHHYVIIGRPAFLRAEDTPGQRHGLRLEPKPHVFDAEGRPPTPTNQELMGVLHATGFEFLLRPYHRLRKAAWRFGLGTQSVRPMAPATASEAPVDPRLVDAWDVLLTTMQARCRAPFTFVYCPPTPFLEKKQIHQDDPSAGMLRRFAEVCARRGIPFLHLGSRFRAFHAKTGRFPRGFPNSRPSRGHFNRDGMGLVAAAILEDIEAR